MASADVFKDIHAKEVKIYSLASSYPLQVINLSGTEIIRLHAYNNRGILRIFNSNGVGMIILDTSGLSYISGALCVGAGANIDAQSVLQCDSTTKGLIVPRMTTAEATTLSNAGVLSGAIVFDTTLKKLMFFDGGAWVATA